MTVEVVHVTPQAESLIAYCARVSSPDQENPAYEKLLSYCIRHKHWSIFEMASLCLEITTSRAIAQQILRHRSFHFQEFSQRYAKVAEDDFERYEARRQDANNRQNSIDDLHPVTKEWFTVAQVLTWEAAQSFYRQALDKGIAKESARFLLPLSTRTKLYMHGTVRDWIHYIELRSSEGTQEEHRQIALACKWHFVRELPFTAGALGWEC